MRRGEDWVSLQVRRGRTGSVFRGGGGGLGQASGEEGEDWVSLQVRRGRTGSVFR